jgi:hypothetical protein
MSDARSADICVIASFPSAANAKDGMIQRVAHIDGLMADLPRRYLDLSFRRFFKQEERSEGLATVHCLNVFRHFFLILRMLQAARIVYVHSAYNALRILPFSTRAHVVFDAHGIVPEERALEGHHRAACILSVAERFILNRCDTLVCVTRSMHRHFLGKHGQRRQREDVILPILPHLGDEAAVAQALDAERKTDAVIYAGGMQAWQNVDKMIAAAEAQHQLHYTFLTGDVTRFTARLNTSQVRQSSCQSVAPSDVKHFYLNHQFGFVLREADLVNAVACPTKLVEYLYWGVLPVVITPRIGDFDADSIRSVTLDQFLAGDLPDTYAAQAMRRHNQATVLDMIRNAKSQQERLRLRLHDQQLPTGQTRAS